MPTQKQVLAFLRLHQAPSAADITHQSFTGEFGGKYSVADHDLAELYVAIGADLNAGHPFTLIERRSDIFRMHLDLDLPTILDEGDLEALVQTVQRVIRSFIPQAPEKFSWCICCCVFDRDHGGDRRAGPGVHLHFPWLAVTKTQALFLHSSVLEALKDDDPRWSPKEWAKILDISVLTQNGLRMVEACKARPCSDCEGHAQRRITCASCSNGKIIDSKVYRPWRVFGTGEGCDVFEMQVKQNKAHAVKLCSTRTSAGTASCEYFELPTLAPSPSILMRQTAHSHAYTLDADGHFVKRSAAQEIFTAEAQLQEDLQQALGRMDSHWAKLRIVEIRRFQRRNARVYSLRVQGYGARYCLNKGCEHSKSSIRFEILRVNQCAALCQLCWCMNDVVRPTHNKTCRDFRSTFHPLPDRVSEQLYPVEPATKTQVSGEAPTGPPEKRLRHEESASSAFAQLRHEISLARCNGLV